MATQRIVVATIAGESAGNVEATYREWQERPDQSAIDQFCVALREHGMSLPVVYYCEWADHWLMGDMIAEPWVTGKRYSFACLTPETAQAWSAKCVRQYQEQEWLLCRLREAADGWEGLVKQRILVVVREVLGP